MVVLDILLTLQVIFVILWIKTSLMRWHIAKAMWLIQTKVTWEERIPWLEFFLEEEKHRRLLNILDLTRWSFRQCFPKIAELEK